jgi:Cft2 family RNA processing exonuclease
MENGNNGRRKSGNSQKNGIVNGKTTKKQSTIIAEVNDFINRIRDGSSVIMPKAQKIMLKLPKKTLLLSSAEKEQSLAEIISKAITSYQVLKDLHRRSKEIEYVEYIDPSLPSTMDSKFLEGAYELLGYINRARLYRVIEDKNLINKLKKYQEQNNQLKEQIANLKKLNTKLAKENAKFHKLFPNNQANDTEIGDVEEK